MKNLKTILVGAATLAGTSGVTMASTYSDNVDTNSNQLIVNAVLTIVSYLVGLFHAKKKGGKNV